MKINFKQEVDKRKKEILADLTGLMKINSELTTYDPERKGAPFGKGIKEALDFMLQLGQRDGFITENLDGYAGHIVYGDQKEFVGTMGHLDVVPAGNDWDFPPYGAVVHDNKLYGRGAEDDKGPTVAVYYAMKILKDLGVPLSKRIKLVLGTDEETGWRGVRHYFSIYPEIPVSGFIPDADFPLIYGEKGISRIFIEGEIPESDIIHINGGFRDNMVPDFAEVTLKATKDYLSLFHQFLEANEYQGTGSKENDQIYLRVTGKSAHGSTPQMGLNAIHRLFEFFLEVGIDNPMVALMKDTLLHDIHGIKLGVKHHHDEMGDLTNNLGAMTFAENRYRFILNLRYPLGITLDEIKAKLEKAVAPYGATIVIDKHQPLLYVDPQSELVQKLLAVYRKHTNDLTEPITIGGGTFARAMPNTVAFGPHFLNKPTYIHQKNEYIDLDDFFKAIVIYTEALYELAK